MNRLKELRGKCGLSLRKLQFYTGIDFSRLSVIEKTNANIESKTIAKLCLFFRVSEGYLLGDDGFIEYYDEHNKNFFKMPYEQYKTVLTDDCVLLSIVDSHVQRTISLDGYKKIDKHDADFSTALKKRFLLENFIEHLENLDDFEFNQTKNRLIEYFETRDAGRTVIKK